MAVGSMTFGSGTGIWPPPVTLTGRRQPGGVGVLLGVLVGEVAGGFVCVLVGVLVAVLVGVLVEVWVVVLVGVGVATGTAWKPWMTPARSTYDPTMLP